MVKGTAMNCFLVVNQWCQPAIVEAQALWFLSLHSFRRDTGPGNHWKQVVCTCHHAVSTTSIQMPFYGGDPSGLSTKPELEISWLILVATAVLTVHVRQGHRFGHMFAVYRLSSSDRPWVILWRELTKVHPAVVRWFEWTALWQAVWWW